MLKEEELYFSAFNNDIEKVRNLISENVNLNFMQVNGFTPLIASISRKNFEIANLLIESGADVNASKNGITALRFSLINKQIDLAINLIRHGAKNDENIQTIIQGLNETDKQTLITEFNKQNNFTPTKAEDNLIQPNNQFENSVEDDLLNNNENDNYVEDDLLNNNEDDLLINNQDENGNTPLIISAMNNNKQEILELINNGADLNIENNQQKTALYYVLENKEYEFIKELIDAGATLNANSKQILYDLPTEIQNPIKNMFIEKRQKDLQARLDEINNFIRLLEEDDNGEDSDNK